MLLLPYLRHLTELTVRYSEHYPFDEGYPLPRSLRTIRLLHSPEMMLALGTLPPHLTFLTTGAVKSMPLPAGVLPNSLHACVSAAAEGAHSACFLEC